MNKALTQDNGTQNKVKQLHLRCTRDELKAWKRMARVLGCPLSVMVRKAISALETQQGTAPQQGNGESR